VEENLMIEKTVLRTKHQEGSKQWTGGKQNKSQQWESRPYHEF
jgi:hypothetical protein